MISKILIAGYSGYVGGMLFASLKDRYSVYGLRRKKTSHPNCMQCDLRDIDTIKEVIHRIEPNVIIHAAGNKDIRFCEEHPDEAYEINAQSVVHLMASVPNRTKVIYISTDYVFDGNRGDYIEDDDPDPATIYGKSKRRGEILGMEQSDRFYVIRTSALFDLNAAFPRFLKESLQKKHAVECFDHLFYSPTFVKDFLFVIEKIIRKPNLNHRIFHCCGERVSRFEFAMAFAKIFDFDPRLINRSRDSSLRPFLFPDLSMSDQKTKSYLQARTTPLDSALKVLKEEEKLNE